MRGTLGIAVARADSSAAPPALADTAAARPTAPTRAARVATAAEVPPLAPARTTRPAASAGGADNGGPMPGHKLGNQERRPALAQARAPAAPAASVRTESAAAAVAVAGPVVEAAAAALLVPAPPAAAGRVTTFRVRRCPASPTRSPRRQPTPRPALRAAAAPLPPTVRARSASFTGAGVYRNPALTPAVTGRSARPREQPPAATRSR